MVSSGPIQAGSINRSLKFRSQIILLLCGNIRYLHSMLYLSSNVQLGCYHEIKNRETSELITAFSTHQLSNIALFVSLCYFCRTSPKEIQLASFIDKKGLFVDPKRNIRFFISTSSIFIINYLKGVNLNLAIVGSTFE